MSTRSTTQQDQVFHDMRDPSAEDVADQEHERVKRLMQAEREAHPLGQLPQQVNICLTQGSAAEFVEAIVKNERHLNYQLQQHISSLRQQATELRELLSEGARLAEDVINKCYEPTGPFGEEGSALLDWLTQVNAEVPRNRTRDRLARLEGLVHVARNAIPTDGIELPQPFASAVRALVDYWYEGREDTRPGSIDTVVRR